MSVPPIRVLVVEDFEPDYELLAGRLRGMGMHVELERVEDEPGMRAALARSRFDIVLCDHSLPRFSLAGALRVAREHHPDLPVIVVSGIVGEEAAVDDLRAGAEDFVVKDRLSRLPTAMQRSIAAADTRRRERVMAAALRESEGMLHSLAENMPAVMLRLTWRVPGEELGIGFVGGASEQLLDTRAQDLLASPRLLVQALDPQGRDGFLARVAQAAAEGGELRWEGRTAPERGGRWLHLRGRRREGRAGAALWDCVALDITELKNAEADVRALTAHLERVKETERAGVAREIHDDIGAIFFGIKVDVAWLRRRLEDQAPLLERLEGIDALLESGVRASQRIVGMLRPPVLDYGVVAATEWLVRDFRERTGIDCRYAANVEELALAQELGIAVFRVLQESLTNILRHAAATRVDVRLEASEDKVQLAVSDNGRGIGAHALTKRTSFGVRGMRERALELGGSLEIAPADGGGTRLVLSLPVRLDPEAAEQ
jgi:signal transduction histidine kinase